MKVMAFMWIE